MSGSDRAPPAGDLELLTPKETATFLRLSVSWLAKARMNGEGPPFMLFGRSVRYSKETLVRWTKSQQRICTEHRERP
jgi:Helix-turn-helix domain